MTNFDAKKVKNELVSWIREWFEENGKNANAVIGISGGKDSTVVAALCVEALGKGRVIGVQMPCGVQPDISDANKLIDFLSIPSMCININDAVNDILEEMSLNGVVPSEQTEINIPARIRMVTLFAVAQTFNGRVSCNCNLSEDWIGYSTFGGDDFGSFGPLRNLTTDEVIAIGKELGLPDELIYKKPSDGLCGLTDEDRFGFTYAELNKYIRTGICENEETKKRIDKMHYKNLFKLYPMKTYKMED